MTASRVDKRLVARRFGRGAATYESVTPVQSRMRRTLMEEVRAHAQARDVRRILELGCGTGQLTGELAGLKPGAELIAVDIAAEMAERTRARCPGVTAVAADAEEYVRRAHAPFDLILSSATVQWFQDPAGSLARCRRMLAPGGLLGIATFAEHTFTEMSQAFAMAYAEAGLAPERHVLNIPPAAFWRTLFPDAAVREEYAVQEYPDVRTFLRTVQQAGATHSAEDRKPLSREIFARMSRCYVRNFGLPGGNGIRATYHLCFVYCRA